MKIISTYKVKITNYNRIMDETLAIYRDALAFVIPIVNMHYDDIDVLRFKNERRSYIENLIHTTKSNTALYDFDVSFRKFPTYLRRAVVSDAIGLVSSYRSKYENWLNSDRSTRKPRLTSTSKSHPALYKRDMFTVDKYGNYKIKIYHKNDWVWLNLKLRKSDLTYIEKHKANSKMLVPALVKNGKKYYLAFYFEDNVTLVKEEDIHKALAVDLGVNTPATCCVMNETGTICGRRFIKLPKEQDQLYREVNKIKKCQQLGGLKTRMYWAFANNTNRHISELTAQGIIDMAVEYGVDVIVFENLSNMRGRTKNQKIAIWRKREIQRIVTHKAHMLGMRVSTVCAWGTSALAYDGSGRVKRGKANPNGNSYNLCTFENGKQYNCDLNASYNIGARYFIRSILKSCPEKDRLRAEAKDPLLSRRTTCTLSSLINLNVELGLI